jgi:hypothetical protein
VLENAPVVHRGVELLLLDVGPNPVANVDGDGQSEVLTTISFVRHISCAGGPRA